MLDTHPETWLKWYDIISFTHHCFRIQLDVNPSTWLRWRHTPRNVAEMACYHELAIVSGYSQRWMNTHTAHTQRCGWDGVLSLTHYCFRVQPKMDVHPDSTHPEMGLRWHIINSSLFQGTAKDGCTSTQHTPRSLAKMVAHTHTVTDGCTPRDMSEMAYYH